MGFGNFEAWEAEMRSDESTPTEEESRYINGLPVPPTSSSL